MDVRNILKAVISSVNVPLCVSYRCFSVANKFSPHLNLNLYIYRLVKRVLRSAVCQTKKKRQTTTYKGYSCATLETVAQHSKALSFSGVTLAACLHSIFACANRLKRFNMLLAVGC